MGSSGIWRTHTEWTFSVCFFPLLYGSDLAEKDLYFYVFSDVHGCWRRMDEDPAEMPCGAYDFTRDMYDMKCRG